LHIASRGGQPGVVRLLRDAGANESFRNSVYAFRVALHCHDLQPQRVLLFVHNIELPSWCCQSNEKAVDVAKNPATRQAFETRRAVEPVGALHTYEHSA
jgi:hypothetical protein